MATPSLAMIPSGYKAGKVYSVLPESGVGDFDFTRATTATRINSSGLIEEMGINVPRLEYPLIDGVVNGCPSLLLEPQRTNLYNYSEPTANEGSMSGVTYESFNWAIGFTNCVKFGDNSATRYRYGGTVSLSTEYTLSAFVIMDDLSEPIIGGITSDKDFSFVLGGATGVGVNSSVNMGNNIWRVSGTATTSASASTLNNGIIKYTGQSSKGFRVVGFQVEQGSYATSYIPTNGAAVTRNGETANGAGDATTFNDSEGVLFAEVSVPYRPSNQIISLSDSTNSDIIFFQFTPTNMFVKIAINGFGESTIHSQSYDVNTLYKVSLKYNGTNTVAYINGFISSIGNVTLSNSFTLGLSKLGFNYPTGVLPFYGKTKQIQYYNSALTDIQLEEISSWTSFTDLANGQQYSIK